MQLVGLLKLLPQMVTRCRHRSIPDNWRFKRMLILPVAGHFSFILSCFWMPGLKCVFQSFPQFHLKISYKFFNLFEGIQEPDLILYYLRLFVLST